MIFLVVKAENDRRREEQELTANLTTFAVWRLAWMMRFKTLPKKPDDLTKEAKRPGVGEDWRMQKAAIEALNAALGGFDERPAKGG